MELVKIYEADNGDIFAQHSNRPGYELSEEERNSFVFELFRQLNNGQYEKVIAKRHYDEDIGLDYLQYYDKNGVFIATADMHVLEELDFSQSFVYVKRVSKDTKLKQQIESLLESF